MGNSEGVLNTLKTIIAIAGGILSSLLGGWDMLLKILVGFVITDYCLGLVSAAIHNQVNSKVGFIGICKKVILFIPIGISFSLDMMMNTDILRNTAIMFYIANEGISIIENLAKSGVAIPQFLQKMLVQLQETNDKGSD